MLPLLTSQSSTHGHSDPTHASLLRLARRNRCAGIHVEPVQDVLRPVHWTMGLQGNSLQISNLLVGYGDADPSNVSPLVHGAGMRVAETRAVNRARWLR
jgi:hypothetical protein